MLIPEEPKSLSHPRFEALCFMRHPAAKFMGEEREWYSDDEENVLGVVVFDRCDKDWLYLILGRDERARFRAIDQEINFNADSEARNALHKKMEKFSQAGKNVFPQGLEQKYQKTFHIFKPVVSKDCLHADFVTLLESTGYSPARQIITEIAYTFEDPDGNYIQQFQSKGFDARLWELYLYATLHELDFEIDRTYKVPDYVCSKFDKKVIIEATTVNSPLQKDATTLAMLKEKDLEDFIAITFGSALYSKIQKRYWEREHVKGYPFVIAVADLRRTEVFGFCAPFLMQYLYGMQQKEEPERIIYCQIKEQVWGDKKIPSGFFHQPDSENVSGILFSDSGTIAKFNRMGKLAEFGHPSVIMARVGERYTSPQSAAPTPFRCIVEPGEYQEAWAEGIWIFHNPKAKNPLDMKLFPNVAHVFLENGGFMIYLTDAFPTWSKTLIFSSEAEADKFKATGI